MIRRRRILKTKGLLTIDCFAKRAMKKGIFDVKLVNGPCGRHCYTEDGANGARLNDGRESFFIVNAMLLRKTATNPASFITRKTTVGMEFLTENPFA